MSRDIGRVNNTGALLVGVLIMALGVGLLLDRIGIIAGFGWHNFWPCVLIVAGIIRLSFPHDDGRRDGGWVLCMGVLLLLNQMHVLRFQESWPLFIVAVGGTMVWKEVFRRGSRVREKVE